MSFELGDRVRTYSNSLGYEVRGVIIGWNGDPTNEYTFYKVEYDTGEIRSKRSYDLDWIDSTVGTDNRSVDITKKSYEVEVFGEVAYITNDRNSAETFIKGVEAVSDTVKVELYEISRSLVRRDNTE